MSLAYNVWDIDASSVEPQYLELALHSPQSMAFYKNKMRSTTARRRSLAAATLIELNIPVPSREKQIEVIDALCGIRDETANLNRMVEFLNHLVKSRFVEMFGSGNSFDQCTMDELLSGIASGTNVSGNQRLLLDGEFAVLKISAVTKGWFKSDEYKVVDWNKVDQEDCLLAMERSPIRAIEIKHILKNVGINVGITNAAQSIRGQLLSPAALQNGCLPVAVRTGRCAVRPL